MIVLRCSDAQDRSLHRKYFVIVACVQVRVCVHVCVCEKQQLIRTPAIQNEGLMWYQRVCSPCLWFMCAGDTGGAMATHFLPEEVIKAPAWLWLCLFPSSNDCHTAVMACKRGERNRETKAESWQRLMLNSVSCSRRLSKCADEVHALKSGNGKQRERNSWCGSFTEASNCSHEQR